MTDALRIQNLVVRYGSLTAVDSASLTAEAGKVTSVLGPNGAGKTTIIETCEGYRKPNSGDVEVLGLDPVRNARKLRPRVGVMLQNGGVPSGAKPMDALRHMSAMYAHPLDPLLLAERLGLTEVKSTYRRMSGGEQQRLKFALAIIGRPQLVFLDEPTAGLDAAAKRIVWQIISELRSEGVTVLLTTHLMDDVEQLSDHIVVINHGKVVATGTPADLAEAGSASLSFRGPAGLTLDRLRLALPASAVAAEMPSGTYTVTGSIDPRVLALVTAWCADEGFMPRDLITGKRRLEDVVIDLTSPKEVRP